jgi:hypothetical protein
MSLLEANSLNLQVNALVQACILCVSLRSSDAYHLHLGGAHVERHGGKSDVVKAMVGCARRQSQWPAQGWCEVTTWRWATPRQCRHLRRGGSEDGVGQHAGRRRHRWCHRRECGFRLHAGRLRATIISFWRSSAAAGVEVVPDCSSRECLLCPLLY